MRRLLRTLAKGEEIISDISILDNPAISEQLKEVMRESVGKNNQAVEQFLLTLQPLKLLYIPA